MLFNIWGIVSGIFTLPWRGFYNLSKFVWDASAVLKEVVFQGHIDKYLYMAIKRVDILPLQRRQKSIEIQILIINKSLFDFSIKAVTGLANFRIAEEYTLPNINCGKHIKVPRNREVVYVFNIENIAQENAELILAQLSAGVIKWHFDLDWQINIPASLKQDRNIAYHLDYKAVPRNYLLDDNDG